MKGINIHLEEKEYEELKQRKGKRSWKEYLMRTDQ